MRRHPRLTAVLMWTVMAAISVAGFAAFDADPPEPTGVTTPGTIAKSDLVGAIGTSDGLPLASPTPPMATAEVTPTTSPPIAEAAPATPATTLATEPATEIPDDTTAWLPPESVERWRTLLLDYFPPERLDRAMRVMWCESRGEPGAVHPSSGAAGLFQHLPIYWDERSDAAGFAGRDIHDPEANIAVAGWLAERDGWRHWLASKPCWDR